ncbi:MAG: hypothetical protein GY821_13050 [Gammaproteobacteria bacterium]|nr:hypothetical protein [Gammaproteobacteria bacterium]
MNNSSTSKTLKELTRRFESVDTDLIKQTFLLDQRDMKLLKKPAVRDMIKEYARAFKENRLTTNDWKNYFFITSTAFAQFFTEASIRLYLISPLINRESQYSLTMSLLLIPTFILQASMNALLAGKRLLINTPSNKKMYGALFSLISLIAVSLIFEGKDKGLEPDVVFLALFILVPVLHFSIAKLQEKRMRPNKQHYLANTGVILQKFLLDLEKARVLDENVNLIIQQLYRGNFKNSTIFSIEIADCISDLIKNYIGEDDNLTEKIKDFQPIISNISHFSSNPMFSIMINNQKENDEYNDNYHLALN